MFPNKAWPTFSAFSAERVLRKVAQTLTLAANDAAAIGFEVPGDNLKERTFPAAVRANQSSFFASFHVETYLIQNQGMAKAF